MIFTATAAAAAAAAAAAEQAKTGVNVKDPGDRAAYVAKLYDQSLTLELLTWIGTLTHLPIVVKGVLRGDSAALVHDVHSLVCCCCLVKSQTTTHADDLVRVSIFRRPRTQMCKGL